MSDTVQLRNRNGVVLYDGPGLIDQVLERMSRTAVNFERLALEDPELNLDAIDLADGLFTSASFVGMRMLGANFNEAKLQRARFRSVSATGSTFVAASAPDAQFSDCRLRKAEFFNTVLRGSSFESCWLGEASFA